MSKKILIILTDGFEEVEAITPIDILRRAGLEVVVAGLDKKDAIGSHGLRVITDILLNEFKEMPEALVLPGGPGAETLGKSKEVTAIVRFLLDKKKTVAAICAAPAVVLARNGFLEGKSATCYPGYEKELAEGAAVFSPERVVSDGLFITSRGPGTAMEFSLKLVEKLVDPQTAKKVAQQILAM